MYNNIINVKQIEKTKAMLEFKEHNFVAKAFIGENGTATNKKEGDKKTPLGEFKLGVCFGTHKKASKKYIQLNNNLYWIDDSNSKYYNRLVDISKVKKDWETSEHLIKYAKEYEYGIEIKINPENIPGKGSAVFIHCSVGKPTAGCIAIKREKMRELMGLINEETRIVIK